MRPVPARRARGFTLIELMVVVALIGVLLAIAIPAYRDSVRSTRRAVAQTCLAEAAQFMERFYTTNLRYDEERDSGDEVVLPGCSEDVVDFYDIEFPEDAMPTASTYALQAVPKGDQADEKCGTLTLDNTGARGQSGASAGECWR